MRPNQVWSADITYIRLAQGFVYLVAVIDWHSRYVLSWRLSNTLESGFCVEALKKALEHLLLLYRNETAAIGSLDPGIQNNWAQLFLII